MFGNTIVILFLSTYSPTPNLRERKNSCLLDSCVVAVVDQPTGMWIKKCKEGWLRRNKRSEQKILTFIWNQIRSNTDFEFSFPFSFIISSFSLLFVPHFSLLRVSQLMCSTLYLLACIKICSGNTQIHRKSALNKARKRKKNRHILAIFPHIYFFF